MTEDGVVQAVPFLDSNGSEIAVEVIEVVELGENHIGLVLTVGLQQYSLVADLGTGALFDFSDYDLGSAMMRDGLLFIVSNRVAYSVDFGTGEATPLNNPMFDPIGRESVFILSAYPYTREYPIVVVNDNNVLADADDDSGGYGMYELYADSSPPTLQRDPLGLGSLYYASLAQYGFGGCAIGDDGYLYECSATYCTDTADSHYKRYSISSSGSTIDRIDLDADIGRVFRFAAAP